MGIDQQPSLSGFVMYGRLWSCLKEWYGREGGFPDMNATSLPEKLAHWASSSLAQTGLHVQLQSLDVLSNNETLCIVLPSTPWLVNDCDKDSSSSHNMKSD